MRILASFGPDYESIVVNLTTRTDSMNIQEVQFAIQSHEIRLQQQYLVADPSDHIAYHCGGKMNYGRGSGFGGRDSSFSRGTTSAKGIMCQLCGNLIMCPSNVSNDSIFTLPEMNLLLILKLFSLMLMIHKSLVRVIMLGMLTMVQLLMSPTT